MRARSAAARVAGPTSVTVAGSILLAGLMYVAALLSSGVELPGGFWALTFASALSLGAAFGWLAVAGVTLLRGRHERPLVARTVVAYLVAFVLRAVVMEAVLVGFGLVEPDLWSRMLVSVPTFGVGLPLAAYIMSLVRESAENLGAARSVRDRLDEVRAVGHERVRQRRADLEQAIIAALRDEMDVLVSDADDDAPDDADAAARVRRAIDNFVRPLSRDLVTTVPDLPWSAPEPPVSVRARDVLAGAAEGTPLHAGVFGLWMAAVALALAAFRDAPAATGFALVVGALSAAGMWLLDRLWRVVAQVRSRILRVTLLTVMLGLFGVLLHVVVDAVAPGVTPGTPVSVALLVISLGWLIAVGSSLTRAVDASRVDLERATADLDRARVMLTAQARQQNVAIGRVLHGPVQETLLAAAIRLTTAAGGPGADPLLIAELRHAVLARFGEALRADPQVEDLAAVLAELVDLWEGVVTIDLSIPDAVFAAAESHPATAAAIAEIVREACTNGIRHGGARVIQVRADLDPSREAVRVEVTNDGQPVAHSRESGVGSELLSRLTLDWGRTSTPSGPRLEAVVPLA